MKLPPSFPARPSNGGPLDQAPPKTGAWTLEPKYQGGRAWVHNPTGALFNRRNEPLLSLAGDYRPALALLQPLPWEWSDVVLLERQPPSGRGSLILLDYLADKPGDRYAMPYEDRRSHLELIGALRGLPIHERLNEPLPPDHVYLPMTYTQDAGLARVGDFVPAAHGTAAREWRGLWDILKACNRALGAAFFEGVVAKRLDSPYPRQNRSPDHDTTFWVKHTWGR